MSRHELEALAREAGYEPEIDDTDNDLWSVIHLHLEELNDRDYAKAA